MNLRYLLWQAAIEKYCGSLDEKLVDFFTDHIVDKWEFFSLDIRLAIQQHVEYVFDLDRVDRHYDNTIKALGTDATKALWEKVRGLWEVKPDAVFADVDKGINYTVIAVLDNDKYTVLYKDDNGVVTTKIIKGFLYRYAKAD